MGGFSIGYGIGISPTAKRFSPLAISGLQLWLDSSDGSTLYDSTSGGSIVSADGSAVKRWEDKSGNARHATEATNAPTLEVAEKNGKNVLNFATSKYLTCSFPDITFTSQTVFAVFRFSSSMESFGRVFTQSILNSQDYSISGHYIPILRNTNLGAICSYTNGGARSAVSTSNAIWYIARARHSGSSLTLSVNNAEGETYLFSLNRIFNIFRIGAGYTPPITAEAFANSLMSEIIVYNKNVSDSESEQITNYLNTKWAIY